MRTFQRVFIVAENALVVNGLKHRISRKYGDSIQVRCFYDFKTCLRHVKSGCEVLIVDPELDGKKAEDVFRSVKLISPATRGMVHTSAEEVLSALEVKLQPRFAIGDGMDAGTLHLCCSV